MGNKMLVTFKKDKKKSAPIKKYKLYNQIFYPQCCMCNVSTVMKKKNGTKPWWKTGYAH